MHQLLWSLCREENGQDLIEYSLLITFFAITTAALVGGGQEVVRSIWTTGNSTIAAANKAAS